MATILERIKENQESKVKEVKDNAMQEFFARSLQVAWQQVTGAGGDRDQARIRLGSNVRVTFDDE